MAEDGDLLKLYSKRILALAADMPHAQRLDKPDATARRRSPLCGSTVTVDLGITDGRISAYGQDVKACALGQAAAAIIGSTILGRQRDEIARGRDQLHAMLKSGGDVPEAPFDGLEALLPAKDYKNRHASILLTFDAILDAFSNAETDAAAQ